MTHDVHDAPTFNRRALLGVAAGFAVAVGAVSARRSFAADAPAGGVKSDAPPFVAHKVQRGAGVLQARDYPGEGPALVMLHGFPDNLHIYDEMLPMLVAAKRRVVTFDFMGFGDSEKPKGYVYNFDQQLADLDAVVQALDLKTIVPVAHDAGGPAAINYALSNPRRIASMVLLNTFYADAPTLKFPELIELCADPGLHDLARAIIGDPEKAQWLLNFQNAHFEAKAPADLRKRFDTLLQPVINENFKKGSGPAFLAMTADARRAVAANDKRVGELATFKPHVNVVWGIQDPYLDAGVAKDFAGHFPNATYNPIEAGHWPQIDRPEVVAKAILAGL
ncbi:alpha/beta hydrolase [Phenylobacterium sp.]|uniref:alpha/beta fold hydrolase n=1 Tax=Phenylobacterium sp. TaxID=1871053 RepID=UPI00120CE0F8|nr:alpha/beta hydrolase [Phenylobacterium sp.]THD60586.1 MAG: alpha/beta hydrolase [Phenylobacterium sp.]